MLYTLIQATKKLYCNTKKRFVNAIHERKILKAEYHQLQTRSNILKQNNPKFFKPEKLLVESGNSAVECLAKILDTKDKSPIQLINRLGSLSQGFFARTLGDKPTYQETVNTVCKKLNLPTPLSPYQGERSIAIHCFQEMYKKLSPTQKEEYENALRKQGELLKKLNPSLAPSMISAGAIIAGKMSGFGVYLAASTLVGAITSTLGITLPFIFYTTMSSAISIFLGPVGWVAVGAMVIGTIFGPDFSKVTQGIILIASLRAEKELEWKILISDVRKDLKSIFIKLQKKLLKILGLGLILLLYWLAIPLLIFIFAIFIEKFLSL